MLRNIHGITRPWFVCTWFPKTIFSRGCSVSPIRFQVFLAFYFLLNKIFFFPRNSENFNLIRTPSMTHTWLQGPCSVTRTPAWHAAQRCTKEGFSQSSGGTVPRQNIWVASSTFLPLFILYVMKNKHLESLAYSTDQKSWFWWGWFWCHYCSIICAWEQQSALHQTELRLALPPGLKNWGDRSDEEEGYMGLRQYSLCCQLPEGSLWVQRIFWRTNTH